MSQVWMLESRMGPLDNGLVHIGYNRPELFRVLLDLERPVPQAAVVSLTSSFDYPPLNGAVNPADGQLYIAGFQITRVGDDGDTPGRTRARALHGCAGHRPATGHADARRRPPAVRRRARPCQRRGRRQLPGRDSWGYKRTFRYGSPNYKADGTTGIDPLVPSRAYVSADGRGVFVAIPDMRPVMQLKVGWKVRARDGRAVEGEAYTTPYALEPFNPRAEGFGDVVLDLTRREAPRAPAVVAPASVGRGPGGLRQVRMPRVPRHRARRRGQARTAAGRCVRRRSQADHRPRGPRRCRRLLPATVPARAICRDRRRLRSRWQSACRATRASSATPRSSR